MRTSILLGSLIISDALGSRLIAEDGLLITLILLMFAIADAWEFMKWNS